MFPQTTSIDEYVSYAYKSLNDGCRKTELPHRARNIISAFTLVPTLPTNITVARRTYVPLVYIDDQPVKGTPIGQVVKDRNNLNQYINIEDGFMSTSFYIYPVDETVKKDICYTVYYVPKGTPCLYLLIRNRKEWEILFPPGTRYVIIERQEINGGWYQIAMICP